MDLKFRTRGTERDLGITERIKSSNKNRLMNNERDKVTETQARIAKVRALVDELGLEPMVNFYGDCSPYESQSQRIYQFPDFMADNNLSADYVGSGSNGHTFCARDKRTGERKFAIKVSSYPIKADEKEILDFADPTLAQNAEIKMHCQLASLVMKGCTPHLALPIGNFLTDTDYFAKLPKSYFVKTNKKMINGKPKEVKYYPKGYLEFCHDVKHGFLHDKMVVLISEWCEYGDLLDYLKKKNFVLDESEWRIIFFQVIMGLAKIQEAYPTFKHNDLKVNNVLIQRVQDFNKGKKFVYSLKNHKKLFFVPDVGYHLKLWDFDFACIDEIVANAKVKYSWADKIGINCKPNRYYDLHYFLQMFATNAFFPGLQQKLPKSVHDFIHGIVPDQFTPSYRVVEELDEKKKKMIKKTIQTNPRLSDNSRYLSDVEYVTPEQVLLKDPFFRCFRRNVQ